jgi:hypothetical protein
MRRYLVVANQTIGGEQLMDEIRRRMASGDATFRVLVPNTVPHEIEWISTGFEAARPARDDERAAGDEERHRAALAAEARLHQLVNRIKAEGGKADGDLGESDPLEAIDTVLAEDEFDEIIISTLPHAISHWLRRDLPSQVERKHNVLVTTVTAKG